MPSQLTALAETYLGIPYVENGRTRAGMNCLGQILDFHRAAWGIEIPDPISEDAKIVLSSDFAANFLEVPRPIEGDVVLFEHKDEGEHAKHLGIWLVGGFILTVHHRLDTAILPQRVCRIKAYYRHKDRAT